MTYITWKLRQFIKRLRYFLLYRGKWKKFFNIESDKSYWEIVNNKSYWDVANDSDNNKNKNITLIYIPNDDYSNDDIKITMSHEEFEDLVKFIINIR